MIARLPWLTGVLLLAAAALAYADTPPAIIAHHGQVFETKKAGVATQGFLEIDNAAAVPDVLTGVTCPIAGTTRIVGGDGAAIAQLSVAAGQHLNLDRDGPHIVLLATHFAIEHGSAVPCSLTFQNAGEILIYLYATPGP
jgi:copper(I)-binding protein